MKQGTGSMGVIALITDYGTQDYYVGALKGVILQIAPQATIVDISHDISPHNVAQGAFLLRQSWPWFPNDTAFVAIVDPGVGTERRILVAKYGGRYLVAPDNGLATFVHRDMAAEAIHTVENQQYVLSRASATFHGRDIMAPVAAHVVEGVGLEEFGPPTDRVQLLPVPHRAEIRPDGLYGIVLYVDRFGTLVTNIGRTQFEAIGASQNELRVALDGETIGSIHTTFADVAPGEAVALIGGGDLLEVAVNQGNARERFGLVQTVRVFAP